MSIIGNFKAQSKIGIFKWENTAEAGALRQKVEKFVAQHQISNQAWHNYSELRALRELARTINGTFIDSLAVREDAPTKEQLEYDILWDEFYNAVNPDGSSKFGLARIVEQQVRRVDPWA